jgi:hypothetical protein
VSDASKRNGRHHARGLSDRDRDARLPRGKGPNSPSGGCIRYSSIAWRPPLLRREGPGCRSPVSSRLTGSHRAMRRSDPVVHCDLSGRLGHAFVQWICARTLPEAGGR